MILSVLAMQACSAKQTILYEGKEMQCEAVEQKKTDLFCGADGEFHDVKNYSVINKISR